MSKKQVFYIHGGEAYSNYEAYLEDLKTMPVDPFKEQNIRWTHSLTEKLGEEFEVLSPLMPGKYNAKYEEWKIWFERHFEFIRDEVTLLGWSLGGIFFAKYLSENEAPFKVGRLYMLAAPFNSEEFKDVGCGDFMLEPELVSRLPEKVGQITLLHSKDDFVVPYDHALIYKNLMITADLVTFEDKNHFLVEEFPELIERVRM